jgi:hypothetical protein
MTNTLNNLYTYEEFLELNEKKYDKMVQSSHLRDLRYDDKTEELEIDFLNGSTYRYYKVPVEVYKELADYRNILQKLGYGLKKLFRPKSTRSEDEAKGTFGERFWELIRRGKYRYEKIR